MVKRSDRRRGGSQARRRRQTAGGAARSGRPTSRTSRPPSIDDLASTVVDGAPELLAIDDPLEAEQWASAMLGTFYKLPVPLEVRDELEHRLVPTIIRLAAERSDAPGLAVLEAVAAVADATLATEARAAAERLASRGIARPAWAAELGTAQLEGAWVVTDVFGDHEAYSAVFRYAGRRAHLVNALVDKALGEIVKDAFVGYVRGDPRAVLESASRREPGTSVADVDAPAMARRVIEAIESGDLYLDNDWTPGFKQTRALLLARLRTLPLGPEIERPVLEDDRRREIIEGFLGTLSDAASEASDVIASVCLDYTCDYLGDDPFRWSPIVVEQFMLDFVPRKVSLDLGELRDVPSVLRAWVRFALSRRGLDERWIRETEAAVDRHVRAFLREATDAANFGPAKAIEAAMRADGVDITDEAALEAWIQDFNARSQSERDTALGRPQLPGENH